MGIKIRILEKMHVVGRHHRHIVFRCEGDGSMYIILLAAASRALQFQVKTVGKQSAPLYQGTCGQVVLAGQQRLADVARTPSGKRNQTVAISGQPAVLQHRQAAVLAFEVGPRNQPCQVQIARTGLAQEDEPVRLLVHGRVGHPQVDPHDRLDALRHGGPVKLHHGKQIALVGHGNRGHAGGGGLPDQRLDPDDAVYQRVLGMDVQVYEGLLYHGKATGFPVLVQLRTVSERTPGQSLPSCFT